MLSFRLDHLLGKELFKNVIVRLISGTELTLNYFELKDKAVEIPLHEHPVEHLVIVLEGKIEFIMEGQKKVLGEREGLFLPAKTLHSATVIKDPVKALEIYTSAEDEYYNDSPS
ncbi:MAG: cupin domain-containing protein [Candidatus Bathyarchaeia archaeon]